MSEPVAVIIDTDPGLDDAVAILLALASPELHVIALTAVAGNLGLSVTSRNALRILHLAARDDIPVFAGEAAPLSRNPITVGEVHGDDGLGGVDLPVPPRTPQAQGAVAWMASTLREAPGGTIRILALGPLTNLARLIETAPDAASRLGGIVAMGGAIRERGNVGPRAEFNLAADPHAAEIVFGSGIPVTLVPLDATRQLRADAAWTRELARSGGRAAGAAASLIEAYFGRTQGAPRESRPLHDPCVVLRAIRPALFQVERLSLRVETAGPDAGATLIDVGGAPIDALTGVDAPAALALLGERLSRL